MNLAPIVLEHGERYGNLTVRYRYKKNGRWVYVCGCACGTRNTRARAAQLMKGSVTACGKCQANDTSANSNDRI